MPSEALMLQVERRIDLLRGEKVMLASDLAALGIKRLAETKSASLQISCSS